MPRSYVKGNGRRKYTVHSKEDLKRASQDVDRGTSVRKAAQRHGVCHVTLHKFRKTNLQKKPGRPSALSATEETEIAETLKQMVSWGFGLNECEVRLLVKDYLDRMNRTVNYFTNNLPGKDWISSFMRRNGLVKRTSTNIKRSRSSVSEGDVREYFENLPDEDCFDPANVYNYDETNLTDDPGSKKVLAARGTRRVENVTEHSKTSISLMVCGNAKGDILPPYIVYRAKNLYKGWTEGAPNGTMFACTKRGWFEKTQFEDWFENQFLKFANQTPGRKLLIGDQLASHLSCNVVKLARQHQVFITALPANSTHFLQPLDVSFFSSMKKEWRKILGNWRAESRSSGVLPKEVFPILLFQLWNKMRSPQMMNCLQAGFRSCGIVPRNPEEPLQRIPGTSASAAHNEIHRELDRGLIDLLMEQRGQNSEKKRRGKKIKVRPGAELEVPEPEMDEQVPEDHPTTSCSTPKKMKRGDDSESKIVTCATENICAGCLVDFVEYLGSDWVQCVLCLKWYCGVCNEETDDPFFTCGDCN